MEYNNGYLVIREWKEPHIIRVSEDDIIPNFVKGEIRETDEIYRVGPKVEIDISIKPANKIQTKMIDVLNQMSARGQTIVAEHGKDGENNV